MTKKIHILGICGTFMGGVAKLAIELGYEVQGSDQNTYPPMSTQLESLGIRLFSGFQQANISNDIDTVIVGNTISRGNPELEHVLNSKIAYTSGAQWLAENVLHNRWVLAVAGTHGKTTTSSLLAWILETCGYQPGFLIGGVPENFGTTARIGKSDFFVIEADEYDTSFADKRSKFVHYRPNTLIINNLEFDHADIFNCLEDIQTQFHHLIKTIPSDGQIICNGEQNSIQTVLDKGCWSETKHFYYQSSNFSLNDNHLSNNQQNNNHQNNKQATPHQETQSTGFHIENANASGSRFEIKHANQNFTADWDLIGNHNLNNAVAAIAASHHVGVQIDDACNALKSFKSVKRRMELRGRVNDICIYDDFAHHPTAIRSTVSGLRATLNQHHMTKSTDQTSTDNKQNQRIIAVVEARSNTMKMGVHKNSLLAAVEDANHCFFAVPENTAWDTKHITGETSSVFENIDQLKQAILNICQPGDHILIMSNGGFNDIHNYLLDKIAE